MTFIANFFSDQSVYALGWTIVHSIWQILVIAIILRGLLNVLKNASSNLRYLISATAFITIILTSIVTFSMIFTAYSPEPLVANPESAGIIQTLINSADLTQKFSFMSITSMLYGYAEFVMQWIETNLHFIVFFWLLGLILYSLRFAGNLIYINRLKSQGTSILSGDWMAILTSLSDKMGIRKNIPLLESVFAKAPMVIGHFKPVILLPAGLVFSMPVDQLEAILAHELAHIKRKDFLINTLKSVLEIIFFYHPAMWWMSSVFDQEREHCCDDITVDASVDPVALSKALLLAEEFRMHAPRLAAAFHKKHYKLFKRIKRMNTKKHQTTKFNGKSVALTIIMVSLIALFTNSSITSSPVSVNLPNYTAGYLPDVIDNQAEFPAGDSTEVIQAQMASLKKEVKELYAKTEKATQKLEITKKELSKNHGEITSEQKVLLKETYKHIADVKENLATIKEMVFSEKADMKNAEVMLKKSKYMMDDSYKTLQMAFTNLKKIQNEESMAQFSEQEKAMQKQQQAMKLQEKAIVKEKDE
nr:M48 family metalloprotease [Bacteroidota bacterium]